MIRGEIQFAGSHIALSLQKFEYVDYVLLYSMPVHYLAAFPKPLSQLWNLTKPFTLRVWLLANFTFAVAFILAVVMNADVITVWAVQFGQCE